MNQKISTKRIAMAGLLAALTAVGSALRITIPVSIGGTSAFHLGNIFCALSGILLGPGLGGLAAGLGSAIYDMTNPIYIGEAWLTFLMKGAYALAAGLVFKHLHLKEYLRDLLATTAGAVTYAVLYLGKSFIEDHFVLGLPLDAVLLTVGQKGLVSTVNGVIAAAVSVPLYLTLKPLLKKAKLL